MILFETYRQLDLSITDMIQVLDPEFVPEGKYLFIDDNLIVLGRNHSVRLNMLSRTATVDNPIDKWNLSREALRWYSENSGESLLVDVIYNAVKQWFNIQPVGTYNDFLSSLSEVNGCLTAYGFQIMCNDEGMGIMSKDGSVLTFEQAADVMSYTDIAGEINVDLNALLDEASLYKKQGALKKACELYEEVVKNSGRAELEFTIGAFEAAECYYFLDNNERALDLYYRCNLEFIQDKDDFYIHVGHALLDSKMKKFEHEVKIFYRSKLDKDYALIHSEAVKGAEREVGGVFYEYERTCLEMGKKKYEEHRSKLPENSDDIDELLVSKTNLDNEYEEPVKQYIGIRLFDPPQDTTDPRSDNEIISKALDLYIAGDYQKAFDLYHILVRRVEPDNDYYTFANFQIGKLHCLFGDYERALSYLKKCKPAHFGLVYRLRDYMILFEYATLVTEGDTEALEYANLFRGRFDYYYSEKDFQYNQNLRNHRLVKKFVQFEQDIFEEAKEDLKDAVVYLPDEDNDTKKKGLLDKIKSFLKIK